MFDILYHSLATGVVTTDYPKTPAPTSRQSRGRPEIDAPNWKDARLRLPRVTALSCTDGPETRRVTLTWANARFAACAEAIRPFACPTCANWRPGIKRS